MGFWIVVGVQVVLSIASLVAIVLTFAWARAGAKDGHEARRLVEALTAAFRKGHGYSDPSAAAVVTPSPAPGPVGEPAPARSALSIESDTARRARLNTATLEVAGRDIARATFLAALATKAPAKGPGKWTRLYSFGLSLVVGAFVGRTLVESLPGEAAPLVVAVATVVLCLFAVAGVVARYTRDTVVAEVAKARGDAARIRDELSEIGAQIDEYAHERLAREARAARIRLEAVRAGRTDAQVRIDVATVIDEEKVAMGGDRY